MFSRCLLVVGFVAALLVVYLVCFVMLVCIGVIRLLCLILN